MDEDHRVLRRARGHPRRKRAEVRGELRRGIVGSDVGHAILAIEDPSGDRVGTLALVFRMGGGASAAVDTGDSPAATTGPMFSGVKIIDGELSSDAAEIAVVRTDETRWMVTFAFQGDPVWLEIGRYGEPLPAWGYRTVLGAQSEGEFVQWETQVALSGASRVAITGAIGDLSLNADGGDELPFPGGPPGVLGWVGQNGAATVTVG